MVSVGGLAAGMAHEINNPLGVILQSAQNVQRRLTEDLAANHQAAKQCGTTLPEIVSYCNQRKVLKYMDGIQEAGARASKIVANMLNFSRRSESTLAYADINSLIDATIELASNDYDLKKKYDFRHIAIEREYAPDLPRIPVAVTEIEQVILNLLKNAAQAMASADLRKPQIKVKTLLDSGYVLIELSDNGVGMDEPLRKRVFEPFFTTKKLGEGTGLGLSVSYFIITNNHKGTMQVESTPDKGSCFFIKLPLGT
jgi:signal transduction histidine kinase